MTVKRGTTSRPQPPVFLGQLLFVVFPRAPFRATNVPRPTLVSSNWTTAPWLPEEGRRWLCYSICIGEVVWLFMFCRTCRFIRRACPYKFWKVCLGLSVFHKPIIGGNWPAWMLSMHRLSLICLPNGLAVSAWTGSQQQWFGIG
jgi:hypothetical protein